MNGCFFHYQGQWLVSVRLIPMIRTQTANILNKVSSFFLRRQTEQLFWL